MTERAYQIDKAVLTFLEEKDGAPMLEAIVHAAVQSAFSLSMDVRPSVDEMDVAFARLNANRWITGMPSAVRSHMKWFINDAGRAALLKMRDEK